jgi:hypothetical protein
VCATGFIGSVGLHEGDQVHARNIRLRVCESNRSPELCEPQEQVGLCRLISATIFSTSARQSGRFDGPPRPQCARASGMEKFRQPA